MSEQQDWIRIAGDNENALDRIRVPGKGWIFRSLNYARSCDCDDLVVGCSESMVFVPDEDA